MDWTILQQPAVGLGAAGGLVLNLLNLMELKNVDPARRPDLRDPLYWLPFAVWPLLGGFLTYLYGEQGQALGKLVAFQIGLSSPLILRTMAQAVPTQAKQKLPEGA